MAEKPQIFKEKASAWYTVRLHKAGMVLFRSLERCNCKSWIEQHYAEMQQCNDDNKRTELNALFN